jgi:hypothetical protein
MLQVVWDYYPLLFSTCYNMHMVKWSSRSLLQHSDNSHIMHFLIWMLRSEQNSHISERPSAMLSHIFQLEPERLKKHRKEENEPSIGESEAGSGSDPEYTQA